MQSTEWERLGPVSWDPDQLPDIDLLRPPSCLGCGALARQGVKIDLHGHGVRIRSVVLPALPGEDRRVGTCWARRYHCTKCGHTPTVLPPGVLPCHLYSLMAIVRAWILVVAEPVGQGVDDRLAYAVQGWKPATSWTKPWPYRWRSLDRWAARVEAWWAASAVSIADPFPTRRERDCGDLSWLERIQRAPATTPHRSW